MSKFSEQVKIETIDKINDSARSILTAPQYLVERYREGDNDPFVNESCVTQAYWDGVEDGIKVAYDEIAIQNLKMTWRSISTRPKFDGFYLAIVTTPSGYFTRRLVKFERSAKPQWAVPIKKRTYLPAMPNEYSYKENKEK